MGILEMLEGGDLRSIGRANEVANLVSSRPDLIGTLIAGIYSESPVLRARCADALEKVASRFPQHLEPFKSELLNEISKIQQQEVRWHVALILPLLDLTRAEKTKAQKLLSRWLDTEESNIVRVCSLQALFDLSKNDTKLRTSVNAKLRAILKHGTPSLKARSRKLLGMTTR